MKARTIGMVVGALFSLYGAVRLGTDIYQVAQPKELPENYILSLTWDNYDCRKSILPSSIVLWNEDRGFDTLFYADIVDNGHDWPVVKNLRQDSRLTEILNGGKIKFKTIGSPDTEEASKIYDKNGKQVMKRLYPWDCGACK